MAGAPNPWVVVSQRPRRDEWTVVSEQPVEEAARVPDEAAFTAPFPSLKHRRGGYGLTDVPTTDSPQFDSRAMAVADRFMEHSFFKPRQKPPIIHPTTDLEVEASEPGIFDVARQYYERPPGGYDTGPMGAAYGGELIPELAGGAAQMATGIGQFFAKDIPEALVLPPESTGEQKVAVVAGPGGLAAKRLLYDPQVPLADEAESHFAEAERTGDWLEDLKGMGYRGASRLPFFGPMAAHWAEGLVEHPARSVGGALAMEIPVSRAGGALRSMFERRAPGVPPPTIERPQAPAQADYFQRRPAQPQQVPAPEDLAVRGLIREEQEAQIPRVIEELQRMEREGEIVYDPALAAENMAKRDPGIEAGHERLMRGEEWDVVSEKPIGQVGKLQEATTEARAGQIEPQAKLAAEKGVPPEQATGLGITGREPNVEAPAVSAAEGPAVLPVEPGESGGPALAGKFSREPRVEPPSAPALARSGPEAELPTPAQTVGGGEPVSKSEILRKLEEGLQRPFRTGHFRDRAIGIYKPLAEAVRLRRANDVATAAHEAGHHINKLLWGKLVGAQGLTLNWKPLAPFRAELGPLATKPKAGQSPLPEGFAEFVRLYVTDPVQAQQRAPRFHSFFESELAREPELHGLLGDVRQMVGRYVQQPAKEKVLSAISKKAPPADRLTFDKFYTWTLDQLTPIRRAVEGMEKAGSKVNPEENAYEIGRLLAGWWGKADHFLNKGTFDPNTLQVTGSGLKEILKPWEGKLDDLRAYITSARAVELHGRGIQPGIELADAEATLRQLDSPAARKTAGELYKYQDEALRYLVESGYMSREQYAQIKQLNQLYVPFYRVLEESPARGFEPSGTKKVADLGQPVKQIKGSGRDIVDPLESIVRNTYAYINLAERNRVAQALTQQASRTEGSAQWLEEVPGPQKPTSLELNEIRGALEAAGVEVKGGKLIGTGGEPIALETVATVFRPSAFVPKGEGILTVWENGRRRYFQVHNKELYRALEGLDQESSSFLIRMLSMPARMLRLGATSLGPEFVLRNPVKDAFTAFMQSQHGFKPGVDSARGLFHALKRDDLYWEWKRAGGEHAAMVSLDRTNLQQQLRDLLANPMKYAVRHPIEALRLVSELSETTTRLGEFARARAKGVRPAEAALASREVTIDFARMGARTRAINQIVAFWNAAVQGTDKFARVHMENPKGTLVKGLTGITLPTLLLWWVNKDDERYKELPSWQKDFFWLVPTDHTPLEKRTPFVAIPKPFLWGMVYGSVFERIANWINERDPNAFDDLAKNVASASAPGVVPTAAVPAVEMWADRSLFTGERLTPQHLEKVLPEHRATEQTSEFSKKTAAALTKAGAHISPIQLDNAIFGWTGSLGRTLVRGADAVFPEKVPHPSKTLADIPGLRAFAVRWPTRQAESIRRFYDRFEELEQRYGSLRLGRKVPGRFDEAPVMSPTDLGEYRRLTVANKTMSTLNRRIRNIEASPALSSSEKRRQIDEQVLRMIQVAQGAMVERGKAAEPTVFAPF